MSVSGLTGRDFLSLEDFSPEEIRGLLDLAREGKERFRRGERRTVLQGQAIGLIFRKNSTRTRVSFEVGIRQLGGEALFLGANDLQLGRGETIADTARVLSRYLQALVVRTYAQEELVELAKEATIPVINGLTDLHHPCQVLADLQTLEEAKGSLKGKRLAYVGDGNNMANSLLLGAALVGMDIRVAVPPGYEPFAGAVAKAWEIAGSTGGTVAVGNDAKWAVSGADAVYTDTWISMGQEEETAQRRELFQPYQVSAELLAKADPEVVFLHCLPAHRGEEVTGEVLDGPHSLVWEQAENRLHAQKAVLEALL